MNIKEYIDEELIYNIRLGNREALELLFFRCEKIYGKLFDKYDTFFYNIGYDSDDIKSLMWEIFEKAIDSYVIFNGLFLGYYKRCVKCEIINMYRANPYYRSNRRYEIDEDYYPFDEYFFDDSSSVEEKYDFSVVINSLDEVSKIEKEIMILFVKGYSYDKIAKIMNMSKKNVGNIIYKIRNFLKDRFN